MDLNALSLKELKDLQSHIGKAIASFEDRRKKAALAELEEKAREMGFTLAEILGNAVGRKRTPTVARYANPADSSDTWTGRGRKPRWFISALAAGKTPEDLAI